MEGIESYKTTYMVHLSLSTILQLTFILAGKSYQSAFGYDVPILVDYFHIKNLPSI
jgi:hypothetical protein